MFHTLKKTLAVALLLTGSAAVALPAFAENPMVGGAPMYASKNIVENAVKSKDHTTLVAAVKAGGLVETLESKGPFTVFAPTNEAFEKLPAGTVDTLLKPENKAKLDSVLTHHVLAGNMVHQGDPGEDQRRWRQGYAEDRRGQRPDRAGTTTARLNSKAPRARTPTSRSATSSSPTA